MRTYHLVIRDDAACYPGHLIQVRGTLEKITGALAIENDRVYMDEMPLESAIHYALLLRQRTARPIGIVDEMGLWPERLGRLVPWTK